MMRKAETPQEKTSSRTAARQHETRFDCIEERLAIIEQQLNIDSPHKHGCPNPPPEAGQAQ